jgi:hypothetical protein
MSKQDSIDLMIQHRPKRIYNVNYTRSSKPGMSSKLLNTTSIKFIGYQVLIRAHVNVNMNLSKRRQMSNSLKKVQIIKTKVKHHFMKQGYVSEGDKHQSNFLFSFFTSRFQPFFTSKMNV